MIRFSPLALGHHSLSVSPLRSDELLSRPVRLHGIPLGRPVELLLDRDDLRVVGIDVRCGDDVDRFLPLATAIVRDDQIAIRSPLVLLEEEERAFYAARTFALRSLRGVSVDRGGSAEGALREIQFGPDGTLTGLIVGDDERRIPFNDTVRIDVGSRSAA